MVSNEEIKRRLEAKRKGTHFKEEKNTNTIEKKRKKCPQCETENNYESKFCVGCGKSFKENEVHIKPKEIKSNANTKTCPACKSEIPGDAKFCVICGETLQNTGKMKTETAEKDEPLKEPVQQKTIEPLEGSEDLLVKLIIEELVLGENGLLLNKNGVIEGWNDEVGVIKYEDIKNIKFEESSGLGTIEITGENANIKIKDIDSDLGNQFAAIAQEKVVKIKSEAEKNTESMDKVKKAEELRDIGAITEEEFEKIKMKILKGT